MNIQRGDRYGRVQGHRARHHGTAAERCRQQHFARIHTAPTRRMTDGVVVVSLDWDARANQALTEVGLCVPARLRNACSAGPAAALTTARCLRCRSTSLAIVLAPLQQPNKLRPHLALAEHLPHKNLRRSWLASRTETCYPTTCRGSTRWIDFNSPGNVAWLVVSTARFCAARSQAAHKIQRHGRYARG